MQKLPASAGWSWIKEGFALFRTQPIELITLFLSYFFVVLCLGALPFVGPLFIFIFKPMLSIAFLQACLNIEQGKRIYPSLLLTGFRSPALPSLLIFGAMTLFGMGLAVAGSTLADGGFLWKLISGQIQADPKTLEANSSSTGLWVATAIYIPIEMALWFAPALAVWQRMGAAKSLFFSFFAVKGAIRPFLVYAASWFLIFIFLSPLIVLINASLGQLGIMFVGAILSVLVYCSFYPSYKAIFGTPDLAPEPEQKNAD